LADQLKNLAFTTCQVRVGRPVCSFGRDTDHIVAKQLGGPDDLSNLWPLNESTNRSSGGSARGQIEAIIMKYKWKGLAGKWIKLKF
jgi:hypothetical protein